MQNFFPCKAVNWTHKKILIAVQKVTCSLYCLYKDKFLGDELVKNINFEEFLDATEAIAWRFYMQHTRKAARNLEIMSSTDFISVPLSLVILTATSKSETDWSLLVNCNLKVDLGHLLVNSGLKVDLSELPPMCEVGMMQKYKEEFKYGHLVWFET